jgi:alpha-galactosidase
MLLCYNIVMPPVAQCLQFYFYLTGKACEEFEMKALPKVASLGAEVYWIDACWYGDGGQWWEEVGSWAVDRK